MAKAQQTENGDAWMAVIGRCLAYLCLKHADIGKKDKGEQAEFLAMLGLGAADSAVMLDSTEASVRELMRLRRNAKGGEKGGGKKSTKSKG